MAESKTSEEALGTALSKYRRPYHSKYHLKIVQSTLARRLVDVKA
jgi:hypothetical protein